jgi:hypothetical protein
MDNIKIDLGEMGWGGVDWIGLAQDRDRWRALVNAAVINLLGSIKCWKTFELIHNGWPLEYYSGGHPLMPYVRTLHNVS